MEVPADGSHMNPHFLENYFLLDGNAAQGKTARWILFFRVFALIGNATLASKEDR